MMVEDLCLTRTKLHLKLWGNSDVEFCAYCNGILLVRKLLKLVTCMDLMEIDFSTYLWNNAG